MNVYIQLLLPLAIGAFGGALSFFLGNWIFKPMLDYKNFKKKVVAEIVFRSNIIGNASWGNRDQPHKDQDETAKELRKLASDLRAHNENLTKKNWLRKAFNIPYKQDLRTASSNLIGISNCLRGKIGELAIYTNQATISGWLAGVEELLKVSITDNARELERDYKEAAKAVQARRKG